MTVDGDLLSASALALAAVAVFYGLWGPLLGEAQDLTLEDYKLDRTSQIKQLRDARAKAVSLAASTVLIGTALVPSVVYTVWHAAKLIVGPHDVGLIDYDAVQVLFLVVWGLLVGLATMSVRTSCKLTRKINKAQE